MQNLILDPTKRDYIIVNGAPVPSDRILESAYYALMLPQGKYMYESENQGSLLHTLQGIKRTETIEERFSQYAKDAINRQLVSTGQATQVDVKNIQETRTGTFNNINVTPSTVQVSQQFNFVGV